MNFRKSYKGGGSFSIQKSILQILGTLSRAFEHEYMVPPNFEGFVSII